MQTNKLSNTQRVSKRIKRDIGTTTTNYVQEATACWFDMKLGYKVRSDQIFDIIFITYLVMREYCEEDM